MAGQRDWQRLLEEADARTAAAAEDYLRAVEEAQGAVARDRLAAALAARRLDEVIRLLDEAWDAAAGRWRTTTASRLLDAMGAGGDLAGRGLRVEIGIAFDRTSPTVVAYARDRAAQLVTRVRTETRQAIRELVTQSVSGEADLWRTAQRIRQVIGLRPDQVRAAERYRAELEALAASPRQVTEVTRMRRLNSRGLTPERIDAWVERYRQRLRRQRAVLIARTEIVGAVNAGQLAAWRQAIAEGALPADARKRWVVTPDDRLCPRCRPLNGQERRLEEPFLAEDGAMVLMPPLHPACRCVTVLAVAPVTSRSALVVA